jgi:GxxExxY protein
MSMDNDSEKKRSSYVKAEYPQSEVTGRIIAAAQEVHRNLGPGYQEVFYQRALAMELPAHDLRFGREVWMSVKYKGQRVGSKRVDFVIRPLAKVMI